MGEFAGPLAEQGDFDGAFGASAGKECDGPELVGVGGGRKELLECADFFGGFGGVKVLEKLAHMQRYSLCSRDTPFGRGILGCRLAGYSLRSFIHFVREFIATGITVTGVAITKLVFFAEIVFLAD